MHRWLRDAGLALKSLRRARGFAALVVLTLSIGIGANLAIFSVVNGVLLTPLSYPEPDRLVTIWGETAEAHRLPISPADFDDLRNDADLIEVGGYWSSTGSLVSPTREFDPVEVAVSWVDPNYFDVLRIRPLHGRLLESGDEGHAVMLSHGIWQRLYGADQNVIGRFIGVDGEELEVVGVLPASPNPNLPTVDRTRENNDLWRLMPREWYEGATNREGGWVRVSGRLGVGVSLQQAAGQLQAIAREARPTEQNSEQPPLWYHIEPLHHDLVAAVRPTLIALLGAVGFVLLIASLNVSQLLLTRGQQRSRELEVRYALGCGRGDLVRQLVLEAALLSFAGGALGAVMGIASVRGLLAIAPANLPRLESIAIDGRLLAYGLAFVAVSTLITSVVPALRTTRGASRISSSGRGASRGLRDRRLTQGLVVAEVAMSIVLLGGAVLLMRSFVALLDEQPGFVPEQLLTLSVTGASGIREREGPNFFTALRRELQSTPGIVAVGGTNRLPLGGGLFTDKWATESMDVEADENPESDFRWVTPGYFKAMGTRVLRGRDLTEEDTVEVILVDEQLAAMAWPGEDPIGKRLWTGPLGRDGEWSEVIGVVESMKHTSMAAPPQPTVFFNAVTPFSNRTYFAVRAEGSPQGIVDAVRETTRRVNPNATISRITTMEELVSDANAPWRFASVLMTLFAGIAVFIAVIGLYGVIASSVSHRTREIGIRVALGAPRTSVAQLVLGQTAAMLLVGAVLGIAGTLALSRMLTSLLHGVDAFDPSTYAGVLGTMILVGLIAAWRPMRRALRVDPRDALLAD